MGDNAKCFSFAILLQLGTKWRCYKLDVDVRKHFLLSQPTSVTFLFHCHICFRTFQFASNWRSIFRHISASTQGYLPGCDVFGDNAACDKLTCSSNCGKSNNYQRNLSSKYIQFTYKPASCGYVCLFIYGNIFCFEQLLYTAEHKILTFAQSHSAFLFFCFFFFCCRRYLKPAFAAVVVYTFSTTQSYGCGRQRWGHIVCYALSAMIAGLLSGKESIFSYSWFECKCIVRIVPHFACSFVCAFVVVKK